MDLMPGSALYSPCDRGHVCHFLSVCALLGIVQLVGET